MAARETNQIFLSHCVASTRRWALRLQEKLNEKGLTVFNCVKQLEPGHIFREEINYNICSCQILIIFMDEAWSASEECKKEYLVAEGHYNKNKQEVHFIIPIILGGFEWLNKENIHAYAISLQMQGEVVPPNADESQWEEILDTVVRRCERLINSVDADSRTQTTSTSSQPPSHALTEFFTIVSDYIICDLCQKQFDEAKMMPCTHTFCTYCLMTKVVLSENTEAHCPKCEESFSSKCPLYRDHTAEKLKKILKRRMLSGDSLIGDDIDTAETTSLNKLAEWCRTYSVDEKVQTTLINNGYDSIEEVLEMNEDDLQKLALTRGLQKKLMKSIDETKAETDKGLTKKLLKFFVGRKTETVSVSRADGADLGKWKILDDLYDDRVLHSGSFPTDMLKFWSSFTEKQREKIVNHMKGLGEKLMVNKLLDRQQRAWKLHQAAMIMCNLTKYSDAKEFAKEAWSEMSDNNEEFYRAKVLWLYVCLTEYEYIELDDRISDNQLEQLIDECENVLQQGKHHLSEKMFVKTTILKLSAMFFRTRRNKWYRPSIALIGLPIEQTKTFCEEKKLGKGLVAELFFYEGRFTEYTCSQVAAFYEPGVYPRDLGLNCFKTARKFGTETYGAMSDLVARVSSAMGRCTGRPVLNYQSFKQAWIIYKQLYGPRHAFTVETECAMQRTLP